jgi:hypothetical protein
MPPFNIAVEKQFFRLFAVVDSVLPRPAISSKSPEIFFTAIFKFLKISRKGVDQMKFVPVI